MDPEIPLTCSQQTATFLILSQTNPVDTFPSYVTPILKVWEMISFFRVSHDNTLYLFLLCPI
jgi:hypothetical protein